MQLCCNDSGTLQVRFLAVHLSAFTSKLKGPSVAFSAMFLVVRCSVCLEVLR